MSLTKRDFYVMLATLVVVLIVLPAVWNYWIVGFGANSALNHVVQIPAPSQVVVQQPQIPVQVATTVSEGIPQQVQVIKRSNPICDRNPGDYFDPKDQKCHHNGG